MTVISYVYLQSNPQTTYLWSVLHSTQAGKLCCHLKSEIIKDLEIVGISHMQIKFETHLQTTAENMNITERHKSKYIALHYRANEKLLSSIPKKNLKNTKMY